MSLRVLSLPPPRQGLVALRAARSGLLASALVLSVAFGASCSSKTIVNDAPAADAGGMTGSQPPATKLFSKSITNVIIEIDYAPGAEPYVGTVKNFGDPWDLFNANALAIFDGKKKVTFPRTLAKMEKLDDVTPKNFTNADITAVAAAHRTEGQYEDGVSFYIVFLPGYYVDDSGTEQKTTLGVSLGDTGIIAMFKPAISHPVMNPTPPPQIIETVAMIHFLGHAVGFVDNGVPVADSNKAHIDTTNAHHCTNKQCVMSFAVESAGGAATYTNLIQSTESVIYGQECLSDARILESMQLNQ
jgi:hypothetical protein